MEQNKIKNTIIHHFKKCKKEVISFFKLEIENSISRGTEEERCRLVAAKGIRILMFSQIFDSKIVKQGVQRVVIVINKVYLSGCPNIIYGFYIRQKHPDDPSHVFDKFSRKVRTSGDHLICLCFHPLYSKTRKYR